MVIRIIRYYRQRNSCREILKDGRYEVKLPWKDQHPLLYDNFILAKKRLDSLPKRLKQSSALLKQYAHITNEQLKNIIVEEVNVNLPTI